MITITKNLFVSLGFPKMDGLFINTGEITIDCDNIELLNSDFKPSGKLFLIKDGEIIGSLNSKMITWIDRLTDEKIKSKTIPGGWLE